jgi:hypothetical protein
VGVLANVVLTVSDGTLSADLPAFDLTVLLDTDEDGAPDDCDANCAASGFAADADDDNDLVDDGLDDFPLNAAAAVDTDGDNKPDDWNTGCDQACQDASGLTLDSDDDNDLVDDGLDACPSTPSQESVDAQGCSETQKDDDGDGVNNATDSCPDTASAEIGLVSTGGCGPSERDTDGDGTNDNLDAFPNDPNETLDSDGDGYGDNEETEAGTDPNDADDQPIQSGLPIWLLYEASKP